MERVADLLRRAREAGLTVERHGEDLRIRGPRTAEPRAQALAAAKAEILTLLRTQEPGGDAATETQMRSSPGETGIPSPGRGISSPPNGASTPEDDPGKAAREAWAEAVRWAADEWDRFAARCREAGVEPPDFEDGEYTDRIRDAILAGDLSKTLAAIAGWRVAWNRVFQTLSTGEPTAAPRMGEGGLP